MASSNGGAASSTNDGGAAEDNGNFKIRRNMLDELKDAMKNYNENDASESERQETEHQEIQSEPQQEVIRV